MEPVFMVLSQSASQAAIYAIDHDTSVQDVSVSAIKKALLSNPLANGSTPDIIVDDNEKSHVTIGGNWLIGKNGYGPTMLINDTNKATPKSVKYNPVIKRAGKYGVYIYSSSSNKKPFQINVFDGKQAKKIIIDPATLQVEGQTSGEWLPLGKYLMPMGRSGWVQVSTIHPNDQIQADAVLFVPER
jgi:hypothetical protein